MKAKSLLSLALAAALCVAFAAPASAQTEARPNDRTTSSLVALPEEDIRPENLDGSRVDARIQNQVKRIFDQYQRESGGAASGSVELSTARTKALNALDELYREEGNRKNMSLRMVLGYLALSNGEAARAIEVIEPALGKSKFDSVNRINQQNLALGYYLSQRYADAAEIYGTLASGSASPTFARFAGSSYLLAREEEKAIPFLQRSLAAAPTAAEKVSVQRDLAVAYTRLNRTADALAAYEVIVAEGEPTPQDLSWMGYSYLRENRLDDAIRVLELARTQSPRDPAVLSNLGNAYLNRKGEGDSEKAIAVFTLLTEAAPTNPVAFYNLGVLRMAEEKFPEALTAFQRAASLGGEDRGSRFAWNNIGYCLEKMGRDAEAAAAYARASDFAPDNALFARNAGMSYTRVGDSAKASVYLERAKQGGMQETVLTSGLIESMVREGRTKEALALLRAEAEKNPNNLDIWFNIGVLSQKDGALDEAEAAYRRALEIRPDDADTLRNFGLLLINRGKTDEAVTTLEKLASAYPTQVEARMALAAAYLKANRLPEAVSAYREVVRLQPDRMDARLNLADGLWNLGQTRDARFHYATVLRVSPNNARALNGMGLWQLLQSDPRAAEASFRKAVQSDASYLPAYNNLAITLERLNRKPEAILMLKRALQRDPNYADARTNLDRMENSANMQG